LPALAQPDLPPCGADAAPWRLAEVMRTPAAVRVAVQRQAPAVAEGAVAGWTAPCWVADLLWEQHPVTGTAASSQEPAAPRGAWLLTHVEDAVQRLLWDVHCAPGGTTWRMQPRYDPQWLRERERMVMARLRGALPLLADDPVAVATADTPVWLEPLPAILQERGNDRERAVVVYTAALDGPPGRGDTYTVRLRWRRLSLRPYRSLGFWLVDGVSCTQGGAR
jgi:hypothetical protein